MPARRLIRRFGVLAAAALLGATGPGAFAQPTRPANGPRAIDPGWHCLTNATLHPEPGRTIEDATIVIRDGVIVSVEAGAEPPAGARVWDCTGLHIYAGLVEPFKEVAAPTPDAATPGGHWLSRVHPQRSALDGPGLDSAARASLREQGFTVAHLVPEGGIFRGSTAVILLTDPATTASADTRSDLLRDGVFDAVSFETGGWGSANYPGSLMGAIAVVRQTLMDAPWHARASKAHLDHPAANAAPERNDALAALNEGRSLLFDIDDELNLLRADKIATEFKKDAAIVGTGTEFRRLRAVARTGRPIILPLTMPEEPKVATPGDRAAVTLRDLMTWEQAPANAARLREAGVDAALTSSKLRRGESFWPNLRKAIEAGLSEDDALAMLTTGPAELLGVETRVGRIAPGYAANLVVTDKPLFDKERQIRDIWAGGERFEINAAPDEAFDGEWEAVFSTDPSHAATMKIAKRALTIEIPAPPKADDADADAPNEADEADDDAPGEDAGEGEEAEADAPGDEPKKDDKPKTKKLTVKSTVLETPRVSALMTAEDWWGKGPALIWGVVEGDTITGAGETPGGERFTWAATRKPDAGDDDPKDEEKKKDGDEDEAADEALPFTRALPFGAYGYEGLPEQRTVLLTNATIWTAGSEGVIENGWMLIGDGKIEIVSGGPVDVILPKDALTIDCKGRHISPGLIDAHSHTGISGGVNEGTHAVTAEVRIQDVLNPDDIGFYRELAGGLTTSHEMHGSANPIGGQTQVIKLRWGCDHPDDLYLDTAAPCIKFALGENVKQSSGRYPQSRMGVEALIRDRFTAAREYARQWQSYNAMSEADRSTNLPPRKDLELEALAEILAGKRLVHCHSYRQDEILMLCRVADDFGFKIGAFQHVLEGYKVAEAIKKSAIGGSSFTDWWAYKMEVFDAIPENGAIMHEVGVCVSFNSDSDELSRRMNTEAAKAVKYGGVEPHEALKFVTLNAAKQLGCDDRVGSLEVGKDADFVIWSGPPLSSLSRCESTWIDGREYFSLEKDAAMRAAAAAEENRIIQKILAGEKKPGRAGRDAAMASIALDEGTPTHTAGVDPEVLRDAEAHFFWSILNGLDPFAHQQGDCGCSGHSFLHH